MNPRRLPRSVLVVACAALLSAAACVAPPEPGACAEEPVYAGRATDEAWRAVLDGQARAAPNDPKAATVQVPAEGDRFPTDGAPPTLTWTSPLQVAGAVGAPLTRVPGHRRPAPSPFDVVTGFLLPAAHAHLAPLTGDVYFVQFDIPGRPCPWGVLTTNLEYPLDAETWAQLQTAKGQPITMRVTSAYLTDNRITEGPFIAAPRTFTVTTTTAKP